MNPSHTLAEAKHKIEHYCAYQERCHQEIEQKLKDMRMILDEARAEGLTLPLAQQTHNEYLSLVANGHSDVDHSGLLLELEHLNGALLGSLGRGPKE